MTNVCGGRTGKVALGSSELLNKETARGPFRCGTKRDKVRTVDFRDEVFDGGSASTFPYKLPSPKAKVLRQSGSGPASTARY
jgi:hypothetical protein